MSDSKAQPVQHGDSVPSACYTPGPWEQWQGHAVVLAGTLTKNTPAGCSGTRLVEIAILDFDDEIPEDELMANARLIAAAPDMLEACELALKSIGGECDVADCDQCIAFRALVTAVNKAKGV